jgi:opacity protein-like surface antigen
MMAILHRTTRHGTIRYRTILAVAVVVGLLVGAGPVFAQIYITAGYLPTFSVDTDFEVGAKPADSGDFKANRAASGIFDFGVLGLRAAAGYRLFVVRIEGEASYRQLKIEDASLESLKESIGVESGDMKALNLMVNVWFDIDIGGGFRPYLGGGVGGGQLTLDTAIQILDTTQEFLDSSAWAFAYQIGGGVGFELVAGLTLSLGYRLSSTTTAELAWNAIESGTDEILRTGTLHHSLDLGLRYEFL